jgi:Pregnancy-associated plasma protein-A
MRTCAAMNHHYMLAQTDSVYRQNRRALESATLARVARVARTGVIRIPVVVHILYHEDRENIGTDQIESQFVTLNRDFRLQNADRSDIPAPFQSLAADTLIEFALAVRDPQGRPTTGITRTRTSKVAFPYDRNDRFSTQKLDAMIKFGEFGHTAWPSDSYLNLWVCTFSGGLLGYAQFPGGAAATDGVVIGNTCFGSGGITVPPYNLGRTAVHEVGHWLNLLHIWGDDDGGCANSDNVDDTPNQADSNGSSVRRSSFPHITCNNGPNGDMFMNYMDYVDDDTMVMFTKGQLERMNTTLAGPRASLVLSQGLTPVPTERIEMVGVLPQATVRTMALMPSVGNEVGNAPTSVFDGVGWTTPA